MLRLPETDDPIDLSSVGRVGGEPRVVRGARLLIRWLVISTCAIGLLVTWRLASAATLEGRVVGVADGDIITVLDSAKTQHRIRLAGIDAPEKGQAFANRSREFLSKWVYRRDVIVEWNKKDQYGRLIGVVIVDGHDVNLEQVRAGFAWWYRECAKEQTPDEREVYEAAEKAARDRKLGLWADPNPVPPWEWRQAGRRHSGGQRSPIRPATLVTMQTVAPETFFKTLKRPDSPNNWLVAPAGFATKPDAVAPVFAVPVAVLRETFKGIVARSNGAAVEEESGNGLHIVATTRLLRFKDDVWVLFFAVSERQSTLAAYSASRVGYWDLGANRRRLADWMQQTQQALANTKK